MRRDLGDAPILSLHPQAVIVLVAPYPDATFRATAGLAGARGFVLKENLLDLRQWLRGSSPGNFKSLDFTGANLTGATFNNVNMKGAMGLNPATLTGTVWDQTTCPNVVISGPPGWSCVGRW